MMNDIHGALENIVDYKVIIEFYFVDNKHINKKDFESEIIGLKEDRILFEYTIIHFIIIIPNSV